MSAMDDPKADDRLTEDSRFQTSETSTISPLHALLRAVASHGTAPVNQTTIIKTFFDAGSNRVWANGELNKAIGEGVDQGFLESVDEVGWRLTENGRSELGPILEMDLKFI